jgi:hypothetical protein
MLSLPVTIRLILQVEQAISWILDNPGAMPAYIYICMYMYIYVCIYIHASFCLCAGIEAPRRAHHASLSHSSHQSDVPPDFPRHDHHELPFRRSSRDHPSSLKGAREMETELTA